PTASAVRTVEGAGDLRTQSEGTATPTLSPTPLPATPTPSPTKTATPKPSPTPEPRLPITGLRIESIGLETKVVPAKFVEGNGGGTWEVPAFLAGHADKTAGAGALGNAVLLGHIDSIRSGDVFHALPQVAMGDIIEVWSDNRRFRYRVVAIWSVPRDDGSVVQATPTRSISIITCTGQWLPLEQDYSHRLVVRADLVR
ncbi:MAG: sortase, partial [Chloroflexota bacterium]